MWASEFRHRTGLDDRFNAHFFARVASLSGGAGSVVEGYGGRQEEVIGNGMEIVKTMKFPPLRN